MNLKSDQLKWLIVCEPDDLSAFWAYRQWVEMGMDTSQLEIVTTIDIAGCKSLSYELKTKGTKFRLELKDGRVLKSGQIRGVLNRALIAPLFREQFFETEDRIYGRQEMHSLFVSLLYSLGDNVINPPSPQGLCGIFRQPLEWNWYAAEAGLPCCEMSIKTSAKKGPIVKDNMNDNGNALSRQYIFLKDRPKSNDFPSYIRKGCEKLCEKSDLRMLGIDFRKTELSDWTFFSATPRPDLQVGGEHFLKELAAVLRMPKRMTV